MVFLRLLFRVSVVIMNPVSPLAWLPIVTMVVSATITSADPALPKAFVISAVVVTLCSLWPTLINTAVGTASIDKDLLNVGRVLKLGTFASSEERRVGKGWVRRVRTRCSP